MLAAQAASTPTSPTLPTSAQIQQIQKIAKAGYTFELNKDKHHPGWIWVAKDSSFGSVCNLVFNSLSEAIDDALNDIASCICERNDFSLFPWMSYSYKQQEELIRTTFAKRLDIPLGAEIFTN